MPTKCTNTGTLSYKLSGTARYKLTYYPATTMNGSFSIAKLDSFDHDSIEPNGFTRPTTSGLTCVFTSSSAYETFGQFQQMALALLRRKLSRGGAPRVDGLIAAGFSDLIFESRLTQLALSGILGGNTNLKSYSKTINIKDSVNIIATIKETYSYKCFNLLPDCNNGQFEIISVNYN
jgi:hypothetical protein